MLTDGKEVFFRFFLDLSPNRLSGELMGPYRPTKLLLNILMEIIEITHQDASVRRDNDFFMFCHVGSSINLRAGACAAVKAALWAVPFIVDVFPEK